MNDSAFKDTDIGKIPKEWNIKTINEIKSKKPYSISMGPFGSNITTDNFISSGVPVIRGVNLSSYRFRDSDFVYVSDLKADELKSSNAFPLDIIVTHRGTLGQVGIIPNKSKFKRYVVSQSQMKLTCDESMMNPYFLFYYLKSNKGQFQLLKNTSTTGVPSIAQPLTSLKNVLVVLPSLKEQSAIAVILSSVDSKIELNVQMNKTLEEIGHMFFNHWFVDFEFPDEEGEPYRSSGGEMADSELGEIPKGWKVGVLDELIEITSGKRPNKKSESKDSVFKVPLIGASDVMGYVKETLYEEPILVIGRVGTHGIVQRINFPSFPSDNTLVIKSLYYEFIYQILKTVDYNSLNVGTTQPLITQSGIKNYKVVIPKKNIIDKFEKVASSLFIKKDGNNKEIEILAKIRDLLLPILMSGKIRVKVPESASS
jgi:type I restriction enzyme S subunit